ncbi:MAG: hypothetical protein IPH16_22405 [Haliscomenobacter sp.]|nr:hypothetical protein [Haliscomenobacter sp.]
MRKAKYEEPERMCQDDFEMASNRIGIVDLTGAMDCTAAVPTDRPGFLEHLGWGDQRQLRSEPERSVLKMERWGLNMPTDPAVGGFVLARRDVSGDGGGGRPVVTGLAPGSYRFTVEAFDHCYNKETKALYFRVVDKIAPVMKCDDQLNITLSNSQGAGYGQQYPAQGYNYYGYAR